MPNEEQRREEFPHSRTAGLYTRACPASTAPLLTDGLALGNLGCTANDLGKMRYNLTNITASTFSGTFTRDDLRSRWQAQLGARFRF